ncbi:MAG: BamA/TamA family outer membrane protein [Epsilonproteobacteria bacterium]|nr:BamA/TamA family outer membrane protein [Campylobacterota bacterium]
MLRKCALILLFGALLLAVPLKMVVFKGNKALKTSYLYDNLNLVIDKAWYEFSKQNSPKIKSSAVKILKKNLINLYKSEGFYDVKVEVEEKNKRVIFKIKENKPVIIKKIIIQSDIDIKKFIPFKKSDRFVARKFILSREEIKRYLRQKGYCNFDVDTKAYVELEKLSAKIVYKIKKNQRCRFGKIEISPVKTIRKSVILSRLFYKEGDYYDPKKIYKSYQNLLALEAFDAINIQESNFGDKIDTSISLTPVSSKISKNIGIGYETTYGLKSVLHWEERNFRGDAKKISFDLKYSQKEKFIKNTLFYPAFLDSAKFGYVDFKNEFAYLDTEYDDFEEKKTLDIIHFQKSLEKYFLDTGVNIQNIQISKFSDNCAINEGKFFMVSPFIQVVIDERDSKIFPKNGYYLSSYFESALTYLGSSSTYTKLLIEGRVIQTIKDFTIALKSKLGLIDRFDKTLPESKLFFAGGSFSNRAYGYNKLGANDAKCDGVGGKTLLDSSLEIEHPLVGKFSFAVFWDSTLLGVGERDFDAGFVNAYGFGIRYKTVIGPLKFDLGFNADDSSIYALHFQIGESF